MRWFLMLQVVQGVLLVLFLPTLIIPTTRLLFMFCQSVLPHRLVPLLRRAMLRPLHRCWTFLLSAVPLSLLPGRVSHLPGVHQLIRHTLSPATAVSHISLPTSLCRLCLLILQSSRAQLLLLPAQSFKLSLSPTQSSLYLSRGLLLQGLLSHLLFLWPQHVCLFLPPTPSVPPSGHLSPTTGRGYYKESLVRVSLTSPHRFSPKIS